MSDLEVTYPLDQQLAPPIANGEIIFDAPWQGRVFGMAKALAEQGVFAWDDFRQCLIGELRDVDQTGDEFHYFDHFLAALQQQLLASDLLTQEEIEQLLGEYRARPHGHDHVH